MSARRVGLAATGAALALALLLAGSAATGKAARAAYPTGRFDVAGMAIAPGQVLDARAIPDLTGKPSLMITLDARTAAAIPAGGAALPVRLDGRLLGTSPAGGLATDHVLQVSGAFGDYPATAALARRISGRDPLPDSETDE